MHIDIKSKSEHYVFDIEYRINILVGDSGTGKTSLYNLITNYNRGSSSIICSGHSKLQSIPTDLSLEEVKLRFDNSVDTLFVIDETCKFLHTVGFEKTFNASNYYILITRDCEFGSLPIHRDAFYYLHKSGRYLLFKQLYPSRIDTAIPDVLITEDKGSGFSFIAERFTNVTHADGKDNIVGLDFDRSKKYGIIYDICGIGYTYAKLNILFERFSNVVDLGWESFEGYVLNCLFSNLYLSKNASCNLEHYYTNKLTECLKQCGMSYTKSNLPRCLKKDSCNECKGQCALRHKESDLLQDKLRFLFTCDLEKPDGYTQEVWDMMTVEEKEEVLNLIRKVVE